MKSKGSAMNAGKRRHLIFYIVFMLWPITQFCIFYIGVNFNSLLLAFKEVDPNDYTVYVWTLKNITNWFADPNLRTSMLTATVVSLKSYLITLVVGLPLGLFFSYYIFKKLPCSDLFRVMLFLPSIISSIVLVSIYMRFTDYVLPEFLNIFGIDLEESLLSNPSTRYGTVMFYNVFVGFGTSVLMYSNKMSSLSPEVIESANLDGATGFKEFWYIVLPMSFSTISVFLITGVAGIFNNQINAFPFFGTTVTTDIQTLGFLMYLKTYSAKQNISEYPTIASLGLILTCVAVPLTFIVRKLLNKFGPSED